MSRRRKYTLDEVKKIFSENGCRLLAGEYGRKDDKMPYICECGTTAQISLEKFLLGQRCKNCAREKSSKKQRHSYDYIYNFFKERGALLLSEEYINAHSKLVYICTCGKIDIKSFSKFKKGQRCGDCRRRKVSEKMSGKNNPMYNHSLTDEERYRNRRYPEYEFWRNAVFERDRYTCQCCGLDKGTMHAHHIESYSRVKELRTEIGNGITLCEFCHKQYHKDFYWNDADEESFHEFLYGEYRDPWYAGEVFDD